MKKNTGLGQGKGPLTLQEYIPEYNCPRMRRQLNIISPSAKRLIAQKLVTTALKNLGNTVGMESEMNTSFDHDFYIRDLAARAAQYKK